MKTFGKSIENNMDLTQKKLSKSEWLNIEVPFPEKEKPHF